MAVRSISVKLQAQVGEYIAGMRQAKAVTGDLITELSRSEQQRQNMQRLGATMLAAGAGIAAGIGLATKAAIDWETAWAGVTKTVDGSEAQLAALEDELREMARTLPQSHAEIAAVAEAAGQLGVATDDIAAFTRTMVDLGTATNMTSQEAATSLAQMANIMGTSTDDVDRLGTAIVDLGNNSATTEGDIVAMAQRIAGAGATIGLSESDVLGFAAALSSVGIRAEAGGSAISRAMISIAESVRGGGDALTTLAQTAGMSADAFAAAYERDAAAAIAEFVAGLGRMQESGQDVFRVLEQLGFTEIRLRDALLRLSSSGDLLTDSLDRGNRAWEENIALVLEADRRYSTTASQLQIAQGQLNDFAIEMGEKFLPIVAGAAETLGAFVDTLSNIPEPLLTLTAVLGSAAAAIGLVGGTAVIGVTQMAAYRQSLQQLTAAGGATSRVAGGMNRAMRGTVTWAGRATVAMAGLVAVGQVASSLFGEEFAPNMEALVKGLAEFGTSGEVAGETARVLGEDLEDLEEALRVLGPTGVGPNIGNWIKDFIEEPLGLFETGLGDVQGSMMRSREQLQSFDAALATLVKAGRAGDAAASFERLAARAVELGVPTERLIELLPEYAAALEVADGATGDAADGQGVLGDAVDETTGLIEEQINALQEFADELLAQTDPMFAFVDATTQLSEAQQAVIDAEEEHGRRSPEYREALRAEAQAALEVLDAAGALGDEFTGKLSEAQRTLLEDAGLSAEAIRQLERDLQDAKEEADRLDGTRVDVYANYHVTTSGVPQAPIGGRLVAQRHGGIVAAQRGLITSSPTVLFGERGTGQEAFIPRDGIPAQRGLALADAAARWHGGKVVAGDGAQLGGPWQWHGARTPALTSAEAGGSTSNTTYNVYPQRADFTIHDLDALQRRQDAMARVNRPV